MKAALPIFLTLAALWLTWSGIYDKPMILGFGVVSCLLVTWICLQMDAADGANPGYGLGFRIVSYIPWLIVEILKSNLHVAKVVLSPSLPIRPRLVRAKSTQRTDLGRVIYANSITLTPGTITLDVRGNDFLVHALTEVTAAGVEEGVMDRKVSWLEGQS